MLVLMTPFAAFAASPAAVNLGAAGDFVILTKTGISTTGATSIVGDLGVSPVAATYMTGFALTLPAAGAFSTSALVTGKVYASDYAAPTPANLTTAVLDMQTAYTDSMGRAADVTELGAGNIGGLSLAPGVYKWGTGVSIPTDVTLSGGANDVWIFQIAQGLNVGSGAKIVLAGGAQAKNIFWVVAGQTTIGTTAVFNGNILDQTAIVLNTGASLNGRALAQTAVTLDGNAVTIPSSAGASVTVTPTPTPTPTQTSQTSTQTAATPSGSQSSQSTTGTAGQATQTQTPAPSATQIALQAQLNGLMGTLQSLQGNTGQQSSAATSVQIKTVSANLTKGNSGSKVTILQRFLISQNKGLAAQALANVGATAYFGTLTRAALAEFQASVGVSPALGNFGAITRAYLSAHY